MTKYITPEEYEIAAANDIGRELLNVRVRRRGMPVAEAITKRPGKRTKHSKELKALARSNGISDRLYRHRINQYKWTPLRAATDPVETTQERRAKMAAARTARHPPST